MTVTYAEKTYECSRAIRYVDKAVLYLLDGGSIELIGMSPHAWSNIVIDSGEWEVIEPTQSLEKRMDSLEGTMKEIMTALINLQK